VDGCLDCVRVYEPVAELCDSIDNDCNGQVDDGSPQVMGATAPEFAAMLVDFTYPSSLRPGQDARAWVEFENVGSEPWERGEVWLGSVAAASGDPSQLYSDDNWPAWDVVAILADHVAPGQTGHLDFTIRTTATSGKWIAEDFQLTDPRGDMMACPSPGIGLEVLVGGGHSDDGPSDSAGEPDFTSGPIEGGCSLASHARGNHTSHALFIVLLLSLLARVRRARSVDKEK
jgi:hypothetical protein